MSRRIMYVGLALAAIMCLSAATVVVAQPPRGERPTPESMVENLDKAVTLTADQKAKILKIYQDASGEGRQGGQGRRGGFFGGGLPEDVEKVLTADQVKKWREYQLQQGVDRRMRQIDEAVTLTDEQKAKVKPVIEKEVQAQTEMFAKMRAQGENADREGMRDKMNAIRDATDKTLESILTKEQLEKYKAMPRFGGNRRQ